MIIQQNSIFIDPAGAGSNVGYYIVIDDYTNSKTKEKEFTLSATVVLSDCSHKIDWDFQRETGVDKIDAAIRMLQEFKKKFVDAKKLISKLE